MKPPEIRREESATATCPLPWARVADQAWGNVIGGPCWYHEEVASTNTEARSLAKAGAPEGAVVIAESQTSGRGRRGRSWFCPAGKGLLISVLLRPTLPVSQVHLLTLVAACAAAEAIEATVDLPVGIKWPNDLFLGDRKAGGILVEAAGAGAAVDWVVAGIGINVNTEPGELPPAVSRSATSIKQACGAAVDRTELLTRLLAQLGAQYTEALASGFDGVLGGFRSRDYLMGRSVDVQTKDGPVRGRAAGIGSRGELVLRLPDRSLRRFHAGEVTLSARE